MTVEHHAGCEIAEKLSERCSCGTGAAVPATMEDRVARAMKERAAQPLANLASLESVLVGSLGDAWPYLARAAIEAMREPTQAMLDAGMAEEEVDLASEYRAMIAAALDEETT